MCEENYELLCLVDYDSHPFRVSISPTEDIYDLKRLIRQEQLETLQQYSPSSLALTKVNVDIITNWETISAGNYRPNAEEEEELRVYKKISEVWQRNPPAGYVSVFVRISTADYGMQMRYVDEVDSMVGILAGCGL